MSIDEQTFYFFTYSFILEKKRSLYSVVFQSCCSQRTRVVNFTILWHLHLTFKLLKSKCHQVGKCQQRRLWLQHVVYINKDFLYLPVVRVIAHTVSFLIDFCIICMYCWNLSRPYSMYIAYLIFLCLTPLSTIFQLYHGDQF